MIFLQTFRLKFLDKSLKLSTIFIIQVKTFKIDTKMNKILLVVLGFCLVQCCVSTSTEATNLIDDDQPTSDTLEPEEIDFKPAHNMIAAIYKRAMVQALHTKVSELQEKLSSGDNAIPAAIDILKITILSTPTQNTIKKAAEHVFGMLSPEMKKLAPQAIAEVATTPMSIVDLEKAPTTQA